MIIESAKLSHFDVLQGGRLPRYDTEHSDSHDNADSWFYQLLANDSYNDNYENSVAHSEC